MMANRKFSLQRPPPIDNLAFLPDVSEYKALTQFPYSEEQLCNLLNMEFGSLSKSSVRNLLSPNGIMRKDFMSKFLRPLVNKSGLNLIGDYKAMRKSIFAKYRIQIRNTVEWSVAVHYLPDDNLLKRFISERSNALLHVRELIRRGRKFDNAKQELDLLHKLYLKNTLIPTSSLDLYSSKRFLRIYENEEACDTLTDDFKELLIRSFIASRQDFYLGLLSTLPAAAIFVDGIFPRYIDDHKNSNQSSMVRSALDWIRSELRFNSLASFEKYIASPSTEMTTNDRDINYAKDKMKLWRKSSCNCRCLSQSGCKHRGMSIKSIKLIDERLKANNDWTINVDIFDLLIHAKMLDNLQANVIRLVPDDHSDQEHEYNLIRDEFSRNIGRFSSYIDRYGVAK